MNRGWVVLALLVLGGCFWSEPYSVQTKSVAPDKPKVTAVKPAGPPALIDDAQGLPWPPRGLTAERAYRPLATERRELPGGVIGLARAWPAASGEHLDTALLRLTLPVGSRTDKAGLAELTAWAVAEIPAPDHHRPALRQTVEQANGSLEIRIGSHHTRFEVRVPRDRWETALEALIAAIDTEISSADQTERLRRRLVLAERRRLSTADVDTAIEILWTTGAVPERYLTELEDRSPAEVEMFRRSRYQPAGAVLALWIPRQTAGEVLDTASEAVTPWSSDDEGPRSPELRFPDPPSAGQPSPEQLPSGVFWAAGEGETCRFALVLPLPPPGAPGTLGTLVLIECATMEGVGGRLELDGARRLTAGFHDDVGNRYLVLSGEGTPEDAVAAWNALKVTLDSLRADPARDGELRLGLNRLRLRLLARQSDPWGWLDLATRRGLHGEEVADLPELLDQLEDVTGLESALAEFSPGPAALVVLGGQPTADAGPDIAAAPPFADPASAEAPDESAAQIEAAEELLAAAMRSLGGTVRLSQLRGFSTEVVRRTAEGASIEETTWFRPPDRLRKVRQVLSTTIETVIAPRQSHERAGERKLKLTRSEARLVLDRAERHPLMLMAVYARGDVVFRMISTRRVLDREMAVLERVDPRRERLRIMVDIGSGLIRTVETRERRVDLGGRVHITERYDDYRPVAGIRAPFRCITTVDDGEQEVTTIWTRILLGTPPARALAADGPMSLPDK